MSAAERRIAALEWRRRGASYRYIGRALGISHTQARKDVEHGLAELRKAEVANAKDLRQLELERIDAALWAIQVMVRNGDLQAVDRWLAAIKARCDLLGLAEPKRTDITSDGKALSEAKEEEDLSIYTADELRQMREIKLNAIARRDREAAGGA